MASVHERQPQKTRYRFNKQVCQAKTFVSPASLCHMAGTKDSLDTQSGIGSLIRGGLNKG